MVRWLIDLVLAALLTLLAGVAIITLNGLLRVALVLPVILFVSGYAFLSMLFPERSRPSSSRDTRRTWGRRDRTTRREQVEDAVPLSDIERLGLSVPISLAIVSLLVFGLEFTVGFSTGRIVAMLCGLICAMLIFALARRIVLPSEERYVVEFPLNDFPLDTTFMGMFVVSLLILTASVGLFAVQSPVSQPFTGFAAVAENQTTGNMTTRAADNAAVNGRPVTLLIKNHEGETTTYTTLITLQTVDAGNVTSSEVIGRFVTSVDNGETKRIELEMPDEGGDRIKIYFYNRTVPKDAPRESADDTLVFWLST